MDWYDGTETGEMDMGALAGTGHQLPRGNHRCGVRLLCRDGETGAAVVAAAWAGMAVPTAQGTEENVAEGRDREPAVYLEHCTRIIMVYCLPFTVYRLRN